MKYSKKDLLASLAASAANPLTFAPFPKKKRKKVKGRLKFSNSKRKK
ncbi:hypothetical protein [uncultured Mediterranean phage uvMED]|nr:hypothetical protein [uncultured Mediterranean phage uvMED]BAR22509.1 hypothetical protein [uncultured Mediterranean phage uvMED]